MKSQFHRAWFGVILFVIAILILLVFFYTQFMNLAATNFIINGIIIGVVVFGTGLCFCEMFKLTPEYNWLEKYISGRRNIKLPPRILRQIAMVLQRRPCRIYADTLSGLMDMIYARFSSAHESIRYITNTLVFLGLLGTFWGLITALGGFNELVNGMNINNADIMESMQAGLSTPLMGMATAFTSSLLGLGGCLIIGFLGRMVGMAQNAIYTGLGDYMAAHTHTVNEKTLACIVPNIDFNTKTITKVERKK